METTTKTVTTIEITPEELATWIEGHLPNLTADTAKVTNHTGAARGPDSNARLMISWGITKEYLNDFLKTVIPDLPDRYNVQMVEGNDKVAARVTWQA